MRRIIRILGPLDASFEIEGKGGLVEVKVQGARGSLATVISGHAARKLGRALLAAAAGTDFAGGEDVDHGDEMGPADGQGEADHG